MKFMMGTSSRSRNGIPTRMPLMILVSSYSYRLIVVLSSGWHKGANLAAAQLAWAKVVKEPRPPLARRPVSLFFVSLCNRAFHQYYG